MVLVKRPPNNWQLAPKVDLNSECTSIHTKIRIVVAMPVFFPIQTYHKQIPDTQQYTILQNYATFPDTHNTQTDCDPDTH